MNLAGEAADAVPNHVETSRRRWQPCDPIHPDHPAAPPWQRQGVQQSARAAVLSLGALARLARPHVLGDVDVLAHPEGDATHQRPRLGPSEASPERAVVALAERSRAQPGSQWDAQAVGHALPATVQQTAAYQERPSLRSVGGAVAGDGRAETAHALAERRGSAARTMGPKTASTTSAAAEVWTKVGEREKASEGTDAAGPSSSLFPATDSEER